MLGSRKRTAGLLAVLFVGVNVAGLVMSHQRRTAQAATNQRLMELKGRQGEAFKVWHDAKVIPIGTAVCEKSLSQLGVADELPTPPGGEGIARSDLDQAVLDDLSETLADLLLAYKNGRPVDLISYMKSRGETLSSQSIDRLRRYLVERFDFHEADVLSKSSEEIYALCWDVDGTEPAFAYLLPGESGVSFWTISEEATRTISDQGEFGAEDFQLWNWRAFCHDNFSHPTDDIDVQVSEFGNVKVADVRLVVKHRGAGIHSISPYVVRFWYSDTRERWIPCLFTQIRPSRDIPRKLYF